MSLLDKIERRFRRFAVPHLTIGLILCQVVVYAVAQGQLFKAGAGGLERQTVLDRIALVPDKVLEGQVWRLVTFVCEPPVTNVVFAFFFWYMFYLMGEALEMNWGSFRYNVYLLIGYLATLAVSFLTPEAPASIGFLQGSVFLAFAALFPNFVIHLFFLLPVKIKWLALLAWIGYFFALVFGAWTTRLLVLASICNFLLFFSKDILYRVRRGRRSMATAGRAASAASRNRTSTAARSAALPIAVIPRRNSAIAASAAAVTVTAWSTSVTTSISRRIVRSPSLAVLALLASPVRLRLYCCCDSWYDVALAEWMLPARIIHQQQEASWANCRSGSLPR